MGPASFLAWLILWILWICRLSVIEGHHHNSRVVAVAKFYRCKVHICSCTDWQSSENMTNCPYNFTYATSKHHSKLTAAASHNRGHWACAATNVHFCQDNSSQLAATFDLCQQLPVMHWDILAGSFFSHVIQSTDNALGCNCVCALSHIYVTIDSSCL